MKRGLLPCQRKDRLCVFIFRKTGDCFYIHRQEYTPGLYNMFPMYSSEDVCYLPISLRRHAASDRLNTRREMMIPKILVLTDDQDDGVFIKDVLAEYSVLDRKSVV